MDKPQVFLQLSQEFGGTKFGPFPGAEIRLGADPQGNDIVLPEALGVLPDHVKVIRQAEDSFVVAPTERTAAVFVYRADGRPPRQVTTPIALIPGDGFSLVTQEGPRFIIVTELPIPKKKGPSTQLGKNAKNLTAGKFFEEIKRQGIARATTTQAGYIFRNANTFIMSGAFLSPRNIIMVMMMGSGWVIAGGAGCAACVVQSNLAALTSDKNQIEEDLRNCTTGGDEDPTLTNISAKLLGEAKWDEALQKDKKLRKAYVDKLKYIFSRDEKYRWVYQKKRSAFVDWHNALIGLKRIPGPVTRVLSYAAATENWSEDRKFTLIRQDSNGTEACGRGPVGLTYRQAKNLGLGTVALDALVDSRLATSVDKDPLKEKLLAQLVGEEEYEFNDTEIESAGTGVAGGMVCIYTPEEDDRNSATAIRKEVRSVAADNAAKVPKLRSDYYVAGRLMKFYAADWRRAEDFNNLDFDDKTAPSTVIDEFNDDQKNWVMEQTALTMAKAVAIPCMGKFDRKVSEPPAHMEDHWPSIYDCGLLSLMIEWDEE